MRRFDQLIHPFVSVGFILSVVLLVTPVRANAQASCQDLFLNSYELESRFAMSKILSNISRADGLPGAVIAARTRENPNYYYHWIRDAGLVIEAIIGRYRTLGPTVERSEIRTRLFDYLEFSKQIQKIETISGLGEPKVHVDGTAFNEAWGRPQNDSPALRVISMVSLAKEHLQLGSARIEALGLYSPDSRRPSVIKKDLDYIVKTWRDPSVDIWEEVMGHHFYTRMVQRRALRDGAFLASAFGDIASSEIYLREAVEIEKTLLSFWSPELGYIRTMIPRSAGDGLPLGLADKSSGMDIAVILGLLHGGRNDGYMRFSSPPVLATLEKIVATFRSMYPINKNQNIPGVSIGRYPEDQFSGADRSGGNPWVLATLAVGEAYYRAANELSKVPGRTDEAKSLLAKGDSFVDRVRYHRHHDGSLNEQYHRDHGHMHSVEDLTWSYAALVTALSARNAIKF